MTGDPFAERREISACIPFRYAKWPLLAVLAYLLYRFVVSI